MLEADKSKIFEAVFSIYNHHLLVRRFHTLQISGSDFLLNKDSNAPTIIYCNHSSWWDGLIAFELSRKSGLDSFVMMEEKQLRNLFLFQKLGAFSVVREKPREAYKSISYAVRILKENSKRTLWIFPQGEILPNDLRPIRFYNGLAKIIEKLGKCSAVALSMRYEFMGEFKPRIFVKIDKPEVIFAAADFDAKKLTEKLANRLTENSDLLKNCVINQNFTDFSTIF
jgi:chlorobactene lauroyltransferase